SKDVLAINVDEEHTRVAYPVSNELLRLPPLDVASNSGAECHPTVFIGIGGTGSVVLRSLRARLCERFGNVDDIPSLQMLLFDTDASALHDAARGERSTALRSSQLVPLTLRQPQEYRSDASSLLEWLNRRWLFNIPRSLTTEGIRPLGRLALVDHFEAIANVLHHALTSVIAEESLASSSSSTGLHFVKAPPRIFVVASMAGGVGSGLVLDFGYLIRTMLEELHISDEQLHGVLVHSTSRRTNQRDLSLANSLSLLTELHHYSSPAGYPGEPACKLPPRVGNSAPFRHTYVTHLGDELNEEEFASGAARIGEYLYQNSVTSAAAFFAHNRDSSKTPTSQPRKSMTDMVRTFGLAQVVGTNDAIVGEEANSLCQSLVARWAGRLSGPAPPGSPQTIDPEIENLARKFANGMDLRFDKLLTWVNGIVERKLVDSPEAYFRRQIDVALAQGHSTDPTSKIETAKNAVKCELVGQSEGGSSLQSSIQAKVAHVTTTKRQTLRDWFFILVDAPKSRVRGAQDAVRWYKGLLAELESQVQQATIPLERVTDLTTIDEEQVVLQYAMTELQRITLDAVLQLIRGLKAEVLLCEDQLREFSRRILHLGNEFDNSRLAPAEVDKELIRSLREHHLELTKQLDRELTPALVRKHMSLSDLLTANSDVWTNLVSTMRTTAQRLAGNVIKRMQVSKVIQGGVKRSGEHNDSAADTVRSAMPLLLECGGEFRYLLVAPECATDWPANWSQQFEEAAGGSVSMIAGTEDSLVVCCESQRVPLQNVVAHLVGTRNDLAKVAGRLHTRIDVEWPSLERWLSNKD
ncbi:MAG TPA: tubulin-like doman-containing protein, partial [Pirellulaceae bacterium]|nr:tubulin-like doman-containing protein [Pirellulaceae bacterium]